MNNWVKHKRKGGATLEQVNRISIRRTSIAFNSHFVATAHLEETPYVIIHVDAEKFRLGFEFIASSQDRDSFALTADGGYKGGKKRSRAVQVAGLMRENSWLAATGSINDPTLRQFEPKWSSTDSKWVISLAPSFEHRVSDRSDIPAQARGIYRYKRGDEIVYIGRGQIRSRLGSGERENWDFETIEYSIVCDETQEKWETYWLDVFAAHSGKLPIYNRIAGNRP